MKTRLFPVMAMGAVVGLFSSSAVTVDPDILQYGVGKSRFYDQTDATTTTANSYAFGAFVDVRKNGTVNGAKVYGPLGSYLDVGNGGPQDLTSNDAGLDFKSTVYLNQGLLDAEFPNDSSGNYKLRIDTGTTGGSIGGYDYQVSFNLGGDAYVSSAPLIAIDNGSWTGGGFEVVSPSDVTTLSWNFTDYDQETDVILLSIYDTTADDNVLDLQLQGSNPTTHSLATDTFIAGHHYEGMLSFIRMVDNPTDIPGANGVGYYEIQTRFDLKAVPEPSTYVLMAIGLGVIWLTIRRRSRGRNI